AEITAENVEDILGNVDGILVPGGFGDRGIEGKIETIRYARENDVPFLGICLGMQMACVEFARNVIGLEGANTTERDPETPYNVIDLMTDQEGVEDLGGTLRLGLYPCKLQKGTKTAQAYQEEEVVQERHRHRYEFNNDFRDTFAESGMVFSGVSPDNHLVEIVEVPENKFFVGCQFHPELISRPNRSQKLIKGFVEASLASKED
ncbi:gamma-glutamyl-gamma-aminobutyrate hydrolase family protein, partial [Tetragenococcus halophilus]